MQGAADVDDRDLEANRVRYDARVGGEAAGAEGAAAARASCSAASLGTSCASTSTCARSASTSGRTATSTREPQLLRRAHGGGAARATTRSRRATHGAARGRRGRLGHAPRRARRARTRRRCFARGARRVPVLRARADRGDRGGQRDPDRTPARWACRWHGGLRLPDRPRPRDREFSWQRNFQVRGDLVGEDGGWALVPAPARRRLRAAAGLEGEALHAERQEDDADVAHRKKNETRT